MRDRRAGVIVGKKSDTGRVRTGNEDSYCVLVAPDVPSPLDALFVVADGLGGHRAGEVASQYATSALARAFSSDSDESSRLLTEDVALAYLRAAIERINDEIVALASRGPSLAGMGTTVTAGLLMGPRLLLAHVGDSRAYRVRNATIERLTRDHSWVALQVEAGFLSLLEAERHPKRNVLVRAVGTRAGVEVDTYNYDAVQGDVLIFCTDGLFNLVHDREILEAVASIVEPQAACDVLVVKANERGGSDNITVIVGRVT